jgi:hypothetical protein
MHLVVLLAFVIHLLCNLEEKVLLGTLEISLLITIHPSVSLQTTQSAPTVNTALKTFFIVCPYFNFKLVEKATI